MGTVPLLLYPIEADYWWQLACLNDRLMSPQKYREIGKDVGAVINQLQRWIVEHDAIRNTGECYSGRKVSCV